MLGYVTIGVSDMAKAEQFYGALLNQIGAKQLFGQDRIKFYGAGGDGMMIAICTPFDEKAPSCGNGAMVAISAKDNAEVDVLYQRAIELGAKCDGEPGQRLPVFYGAYVRDADNNKLCFYKMSS